MITIYIIENDINDKVYIGQTKQFLDNRFNSHLNDKKSLNELHVDIRKYDKCNFRIKELISDNFTQEEANELERFFINKYNSLAPSGYNIYNGGNKGAAMPEWLKKQISNKLKGREIKWKDKVSKSIKDKWKEKEYRDMMVKAHTHPHGKYKKHTKPLRLKLDVDKINAMYNNGYSIYSIAKNFKVSHGTIKKRIKRD